MSVTVTGCEPNSALLLPRLRVAYKPYAHKTATRTGLSIGQSADVTARFRVIAMFPVANTTVFVRKLRIQSTTSLSDLRGIIVSLHLRLKII